MSMATSGQHLLFHSFCFIKKIGPGQFEIDTSFHSESSHSDHTKQCIQTKLQSLKVIYNKDQYNTMLKDNVHGQKVKSCTIEINTIQNAQRCPGARSK